MGNKGIVKEIHGIYEKYTLLDYSSSSVRQLFHHRSQCNTEVYQELDKHITCAITKTQKTRIKPAKSV